MTAPKLVLHPTRPATGLAVSAIREALQGLGLLGPAFRLDGRQHHRTGPAFLDHLGFLGCAPAIVLDPPGTDLAAAARAGRFCHIQLSEAGPAPRVRLQAGRRPRCPACRADIDPSGLADPRAGGQTVCDGCGHAARAWELHWRQAGGFAEVFLDIWGIHAAEAVPGERLLDSLGRLGGGTWGFFYLED
ncbi:MAG: hypothetical protein ABR553_07380 [Gammaproteobacteria bacterium]